MKIISLLIIMSFLVGCSTQSKSQIYGAVAGSIVCGVLGSHMGKELSPDKESIGLNRTIGVASGAAVCGAAGYLIGRALYKADPRNNEMEPIQIEQKRNNEPAQQELINQDFDGINLSELSITPNGVSTIPLVNNLPDALKQKIPKQQVLHYEIKPQIIKTKDGRNLYFGGGEAIEHKLEAQ